MRQFDAFVPGNGASAQRPRWDWIWLPPIGFPYRAPAASVSVGVWPDGLEPCRLANELRSIVNSQGEPASAICAASAQSPTPRCLAFRLPIIPMPEATQ